MSDGFFVVDVGDDVLFRGTALTVIEGTIFGHHGGVKCLSRDGRLYVGLRWRDFLPGKDGPCARKL